MESGAVSVEHSPQPEPVARHDPSEGERAIRRSNEQDGVRVEISDRARELHAQQPTQSAPAPAITGTNRRPPPAVAAVHGMPSGKTVASDPAEVSRRSLEERAGMRSIPEAEPAQIDREQPVNVYDEARRNVEHARLQQASDRQDLETAIAAAPQSGVLSSEEHAENRRHDPDLLGEPDDSERAKVARETFTKAGLVEAQTEAELVTRFAEQAFEQDLGRPSRVNQVLGSRSQPTSNFES